MIYVNFFYPKYLCLTSDTDTINDGSILNNNENKLRFIIYKKLGSGNSGNVYLIKNNTKYYSIKISHNDTKNEIYLEIQNLLYNLKKYNFKINQYPYYYGILNNIYYYIVYPFFGYDNLKNHSYNFTLLEINNILNQLFYQIINLQNMIHCDIKSDNIAIDDKYNINIIDLGLLSHINNRNIISTAHITSPESLLTLDKYFINHNLPLDKHDYYGLFSIIIDLYCKKTYWNILSKYIINYCNISSEYIHNEYIYVYIYFKFYFKSKDKLNNIYLFYLINKIELENPFLLEKKYLLFFDFYELYIKPNLKYSIDKTYLYNLIYFDPNKRLQKKNLLNITI